MQRWRNMNRAKEYLRQYRKAVERCRQCQDTIDAITATLETITLDSDGMPRGTDISDRTGRLAVQLADISSRLEVMIADAWTLRTEIEGVIQSVPVPEQSRLLYDRYVLFKDWREIADGLHFDEVYTRGRLHLKALQAVEEIVEKGQKDTKGYITL